VLDEPTSGLDPLKEAVFQACIEETRAAGRTVLLSSHILAEVEAACDKVTIIRDGRTVEQGSIADLRHLTHLTIEAELASPPDPRWLDGVPGVSELVVDGRQARFRVDPASLDTVLRRLTDLGVRNLLSREPTLEEVFLRSYDVAGDGIAATEAVEPPSTDAKVR
jgi:ABC-2 type transport system ATP-binding protein